MGVAETFHFCRFLSPFGRLTVAASSRGLAYLELPGDDTASGKRLDQITTNPDWALSPEALHQYVRQLCEYFAGARRQFTFPMDLRGTEFQQRCWHELLAIPYGETRTYADIARAVGRPRAYRAVGMANHDNPLPIVVPCHRVIASDGSLGGYGGGLEMKRKLLELEAASVVLRSQKAGPSLGQKKTRARRDSCPLTTPTSS